MGTAVAATLYTDDNDTLVITHDGDDVHTNLLVGQPNEGRIVEVRLTASDIDALIEALEDAKANV